MSKQDLQHLFNIILDVCAVIEHDSIYNSNETINTCISDIESDIKNCICELD